MVKIVFATEIIEVCDEAVEIKARELREYLQSKYGDSAQSKLKQVKNMLQRDCWTAIERGALEKTKTELLHMIKYII